MRRCCCPSLACHDAAARSRGFTGKARITPVVAVMHDRGSERWGDRPWVEQERFFAVHESAVRCPIDEQQALELRKVLEAT